MSSRVLKSLIVANVLILIIGLTTLTWRSRQQNAKQQQKQDAVGVQFEAEGVMSQQEWAHFCEVSDEAAHSHKISDANLDGNIASIRSSLADASSPILERRSLLCLQLTDAKQWTKSQQAKVYDLTVLLLQARLATDQDSGLLLATYLGDRRLLPYILPLQNSPQQNVREAAGDMLRSMTATASAKH